MIIIEHNKWKINFGYLAINPLPMVCFFIPYSADLHVVLLALLLSQYHHHHQWLQLTSACMNQSVIVLLQTGLLEPNLYLCRLLPFLLLLLLLFLLLYFPSPWDGRSCCYLC